LFTSAIFCHNCSNKAHENGRFPLFRHKYIIEKQKVVLPCLFFGHPGKNLRFCEEKRLAYWNY